MTSIDPGGSRVPGEIPLALLAGLFCGLADALAVQTNFLAARGGVAWVPVRIWFVFPLVWTAVCAVPAVAAIAFRPWDRLHRLLPATLVVIGPGFLLLSRVLTPIRLPLPRLGSLIPALVWLLVIVPLAILAYRKGSSLMRAGRRTFAAALLLLVVAGAGAMAGLVPRSAAEVAEPREGLPNIVLVVLDTLRYDHSGMAPGLEDRAPSLAAFARNALVFDHAWAPAPWTLFSHFAMVTGTGTGELAIDYDHQTYRGGRATLAEALRARGYATGAVVANAYLNEGNGFARGYESFIRSRAQLDLCRSSLGLALKNFGPYLGIETCVWDGGTVTAHASRLVRSLRRPYFLTLNYMDVHIPYIVARDCPERDQSRFRMPEHLPPLVKVNRLGTPLAEKERREALARYGAAARCLDRAVGRLLEEISSQPDASNTVIIVTSDHGEQFGEHELTLHANSVYRQALHVPLAIAGPGIAAGRTSSPADVKDVYGTVLALAGREGAPSLLEPPPSEAVLGLHRPPRRIFKMPVRIEVPLWSAVGERYHYILGGDGREELYDVIADPEESTNRAADPSLGPERAALRDALPDDALAGEQRARERDLFYSLGYMQ